MAETTKISDGSSPPGPRSDGNGGALGWCRAPVPGSRRHLPSRFEHLNNGKALVLEVEIPVCGPLRGIPLPLQRAASRARQTRKALLANPRYGCPLVHNLEHFRGALQQAPQCPSALGRVPLEPGHLAFQLLQGCLSASWLSSGGGNYGPSVLDPAL